MPDVLSWPVTALSRLTVSACIGYSAQYSRGNSDKTDEHFSIFAITFADSCITGINVQACLTTEIKASPPYWRITFESLRLQVCRLFAHLSKT